jgi:hypothetical protein
MHGRRYCELDAGLLIVTNVISILSGIRRGFGANVQFPQLPIKHHLLATGAAAMHQEDTINPVATAHDDVEAAERELQALLAEARLEVRREYAAEAVRRLKIRRHCVAAVVQRLMSDDVADVEFADLVDELTVA